MSPDDEEFQEIPLVISAEGEVVNRVKDDPHWQDEQAKKQAKAVEAERRVKRRRKASGVESKKGQGDGSETSDADGEDSSRRKRRRNRSATRAVIPSNGEETKMQPRKPRRRVGYIELDAPGERTVAESDEESFDEGVPQKLEHEEADSRANDVSAPASVSQGRDSQQALGVLASPSSTVSSGGKAGDAERIANQPQGPVASTSTDRTASNWSHEELEMVLKKNLEMSQVHLAELRAYVKAYPSMADAVDADLKKTEADIAQFTAALSNIAVGRNRTV